MMIVQNFIKFHGSRGEIGRHATLRGWCSQGRAGSNPVVGTFKLHQNLATVL